MRRLQAVFFDLDGILVNSLHFHWLKVREFTGVDISLEEFKSVHVGNFFCGFPHVAWLSEADWGLYPEFIFDDHMSIPMVQSAKSVISELFQKYLLFIVTSGSTKNTSAILQRHEVLSCFLEVLGFEAGYNEVGKISVCPSAI